MVKIGEQMQIKTLRKNALIVLGLMLTVIAQSAAQTSTQAASVAAPAKDFTLKSREGPNIRLKELSGDVILINFWASWCGPCRKELPKLEDLHQKYKDLGVTIIGINVDVDPELSKILLKDHPVTFMVLYDPENNVSADYDIQAMPSTFLVDKNGLLRFRHNGYLAGYEHKYDAQIKQLLRE
ncbi:MAG: redoxin [Gammaproteobacteria bacterium]|nr:MAG: redoxin [Gammaproteobacteria bacterium]